MRITFRRTTSRALAVSMTAVLSVGALAACSSDSSDSDDSASGETRTVTDARGEVEIPADPERVAAFDNRIFQVLADWDIDLVSAPVTLIPDTIEKYHDDTEIHDTGSHREPNLEELVAADPDLIVTGYRYASQYDEMKELLPDTPIIDLSFGEDAEGEANQPLEETLKQITDLIGEVFGKEDEADALVADFDEAKERAKAAYNPEETVMGVIVSGGDISYSAPTTGRSIGPVFDMLELTPSLERDGSSNHQGDDISVEAIAQSNPDWLIVMDRDAAVSSAGEDARPADEVIAESEALQNVPAVKDGNIVYFPDDFYTTEDIEAYTTALNNIADAFEANDSK